MCEDPAHGAQTEEKSILGRAGRSRNGTGTRREPETLSISGREENQAGAIQAHFRQVADRGVAARLLARYSGWNVASTLAPPVGIVTEQLFPEEDVQADDQVTT